MDRIRTPTDLGLAIRERREELGLSQAVLAARAGVSRQWLVEVEKGKARAELALVLRTVEILGLELRATVEAPPPLAPTTNPLSVIDIDAIIDRARGKG